MSEARKIIIDTDPGIDDAMAILYALSDPGLALLGLTTVFGNIPVATATQNALSLLELAGVDVPVAEGAARPRVQPPHPHPDFVHGSGGFGGVDLGPPSSQPDPRKAAEFIVDTVQSYPGEVTLIPVGPLTNIAAALDLAPEIASLVAEVIVMGGAFATRGNVTPHAEANIWQDPHAADHVFSAEWPMRLIGLDVTEKVRCTHDDFDTLAANHPRTCGPLARMARFYMDFHFATAGFDGCYMHDPTAVIAALCPEHFTTEVTGLSAMTDGAEAGATRACPARPPVAVSIDVDAAAVRRRFLDIIATGPLP